MGTSAIILIIISALEHEQACLCADIGQSVCSQSTEEGPSVAPINSSILKKPHHRDVRS